MCVRAAAAPKNPNKVWLHHKFIVIDYGTDHPVVITGSHNMSSSAEQQNDETLIVIRDRAIVESYYRMFSETYEHPQTEGEQRSTDGLPALANHRGARGGGSDRHPVRGDRQHG